MLVSRGIPGPAGPGQMSAQQQDIGVKVGMQQAGGSTWDDRAAAGLAGGGGPQQEETQQADPHRAQQMRDTQEVYCRVSSSKWAGSTRELDRGWPQSRQAPTHRLAADRCAEDRCAASRCATDRCATDGHTAGLLAGEEVQQEGWQLDC